MALKPAQFLDALLQLPKIRSASLSPDGKWVAWDWMQVGPYADIYVAPSDGSGEPLRLTHSEEDSWLVSWAPDSRSVIMEEDCGGDERYTLYRLAIDRPGDAQALTEASPAYFLRGGQIDKGERYLVYGANIDVASGEITESTQVIRQDLSTGERISLTSPKKGAYSIPRLSPTGQHIIYERKDLHPSGQQIWMVDIDGQSDREILNCGDAKKVDGTWSADGQSVVYLEEVENHRRVGIYDIHSGEKRLLIDDAARNIESIYCPKQGKRAVIVEIQDACLRASLLDLKSGVEEKLPTLPGSLKPVAPLPDGRWLLRYHASTHPTELFVGSLRDFDPQGATGLSQVWNRTCLSRGDLAAAEDYRWQAEDGMAIQGWLYRTPHRPKGLILYIHGGPTAHSSDALSPEIQYYASQGFHVLAPNYRGSTGFGLAFQEAIKEDGWGGREQSDILDGVKALLKDGIACAGRVGITGTSYGGYSSWCAITRYPRKFIAAAAPSCGMTDLVVDYETTRPDLRPYSEEMMGGRPDEVPDRYAVGSPIHFVKQMEGELLILQGAKDPNVTMDNVSTVAKALDAAEKSYEIMVFGDEGHGVRKPHNLRRLYPRLVQFFEGAFDRATIDLMPDGVKNPPVEAEGAFTLVGYETTFIHIMNEDYSGPKDIGGLWGRFLPDVPKIEGRLDEPLLGACYCLKDESKRRHPGELGYMAGAKVKVDTPIPEGMVSMEVPAGLYAKFTHTGPLSSLRQTVEYAYQTWLPTSGYQHGQGADIEVYGPAFDPQSEDSEMGYWIPLTRREG